MRLNVDLSVFALPAHAVGRVHGAIDLEVVPRQGELIGFTFPNNGVLPLNIPSYPHQLRVEQVLHSPKALAEQVTLMIEPLTLNSIAEARSVMEFLEKGFGLYSDEYLQDET